MKIRLLCMCLVLLLFFTSCSGSKRKDSAYADELERAKSIEEDQRYPMHVKNQGVPGSGQQDGYHSSGTDKVEWENVTLYFHDSKQEKLVPETRKIAKLSKDDFIYNVIQALINGPKNSSLKPVINKDTKIRKIEQIDTILNVDLSYEYLLSNDLTAARISLANTVTGIEPYKYINILVENHELTNDGKPTGSIVGLIPKNTNNYSILEADGIKNTNKTGINSVNIELYFQDCESRWLVPEVRNVVYYNKGELPKAIVEEVLKGPQDVNGGKKPTIPKGTVLKDIKLVENGNTGKKGAVLFFSREFKLNYQNSLYKEPLLLGSLVLSLSGIYNISYVKIYYENVEGEYVDFPLNTFPLNKNLDDYVFSQYIGRTVKVYFGNTNSADLVSEYRAIKRNEDNIPLSIINKLHDGPKYSQGKKLMPDNINKGDIDIRVDGKTAYVDLPNKFFSESEKKVNYILLLYSIVNSLTDPLNSCSITEVQFLVDGKITDNIKGISLSEPFFRNHDIS